MDLLNNEKGKKIYIANFLPIHGGTLVLSAMCAYLRKFGYDARLLIRDYNQYGKTKKCISRLLKIKNNIKIAFMLFLSRYSLLPARYRKRRTSINIAGISELICFKILPPFNKDSIIIYPEVIFGNPFKIKSVVRYLLYHQEYSRKENSYSSSDKFIAYRMIFNDKTLNPQNIIITFNLFDSQLYRQYNFGDRKGVCYLIYKGRDRKDLPHVFDGKVFKKIPSQEELVNTFNECKYCYSYDPQSFYNSIAAVCGCIPIVVLEPGKTPQDYLSPGEMHYGVAYGDTPEQIEYAIQTRDKLLESLDFETLNKENTIKLIRFLEASFGPLRKITN